MIDGIITLVFMFCFIGVTIWAYSRRNRARFDDAAQLPLTDEPSDQAKAPGKNGGDGLPPCCGGTAR